MSAPEFDPALVKVLDEVVRSRCLSLDDALAVLTAVAEWVDGAAEVRGEHSGGWFWTQAEWADWSNTLARMLPEEYGDDVAQEAIIEHALADLVRRASEADTAYQRGMVEGARQVLAEIVKTRSQIGHAMKHAKAAGDLVGRILSACLADKAGREPLDRRVVAQAAHDAAEAASRAYLNAREAQRQVAAAREAVARIEGGA